ncbi:unnamed protein product [Heterobilharzia americana]|nr:unnamed protein product [Heterobilharzia americana]
MEHNDLSSNPPSVIWLNRSKYNYANLSMSTEDNDDDDAYDPPNNYNITNRVPHSHHHHHHHHHHNLSTSHNGRHKAYAESMFLSKSEYTKDERSEKKSYCTSNKLSPPYYIDPDVKYKLYTPNKRDANLISSESLKSEQRNYDNVKSVTGQNDHSFTRGIPERLSLKKSQRITELINLLSKNVDEQNQQNTHVTNNNNKIRPVSSVEESGLPEGEARNQSFSGKIPRTTSLHSYTSHTNFKPNNHSKFSEQQSNNNFMRTEDNHKDDYPMMSISDRIACIRQNSLNWRERLGRPMTEEERPCNLNQIRMSLCENQEAWRKRVQYGSENDTGDIPDRIKKSFVHNNTESYPLKRFNSQDSSPMTPKYLPAEPILRNASKENQESRHPAAVARTTSLDGPMMTKPSPLAKQTSRISQNVQVPAQQDKALTDFFKSTSVLESSDQPASLNLPALTSQPNEELKTVYERIADARCAARPEKRKPPKDLKNPLKALKQRENIKSNYEEICLTTTKEQPSSVNITPFQMLSRSVDPAVRIGLDSAVRSAVLAESAKAGLTSTEDINGAKSNLRSVQDRPSFGISTTARQLLPYKSPMLLHIKGRRHVQVRLVAPSAKSMNSGDCFILVTTSAVLAWFGGSANIVEVNKTRELASWIYKKHELCYHGSLSEAAQILGDGYLSVYENASSYGDNEDLDTEGYIVISDGVNRSFSATLKFWKILGYDSPQMVHAAGPPEEDERYELMVQHTNRVYRVTPNQLVPCEEYWGSPVKYKLLQSDQAFVFDFGSEMYLWTGKQITPELRQAGIELVQKAYNMNYDFGQCRLNPLDPLNSHNSDILASGLTEKGETVLFKEKFFDWPDTSRIQVKSLKPGKSASMDSSPAAASLTMEPFSAVELYEAAFNNPPPAPNLLTLEGRYIGRGGKTDELRVWHVSEFARFELPVTSHGQLHREDTYVIRWSYKIAFNSQRNGSKRNSENAREYCAYFFWQGSHSKITEKGAAALMTIELDEERGPQVRVVEGKEPPVFCHLFNGRMIIHEGKRATPKQESKRMFIVRGEVLEEGHLIEVPVHLSSLRPQGVLLLVHYVKSMASDSAQSIKAYCWIGRLVPQAYLATAKYVCSQLRNCCPSELGVNITNIHEVYQNDRNEISKEFLDILKSEDELSFPLCMNVIKSHGRLAVWQFTHHRGRKLGVERLNYALQPDPLTYQPAFPFLLGDLYSVSQPSLFLIVSGLPAVYIWQGWWPLSSAMKSRLTPQNLQRSCSTYTRPHSLQWNIRMISDGTSVEGSLDLDDTKPSALTGTGRARFFAVRKSAMYTSKALADKLNTKAYLIYAGLEPPEFLALFPPYIRISDAVAYHQFEEGKIDGQKDLVDDLLASYSSAAYTLSDLQQRPLPPELDATCLEKYLDDKTFETFTFITS